MSVFCPTSDPSSKGTILEGNSKKLNLKRTIQDFETPTLSSKTSSIMKTLHAVDDFTSLLGNRPTVDCLSDAPALRHGFLSYKRSRRTDNDLQHYNLIPDP